ncbi:MAG: hypothetical protein MSH25_05425 [Desulfovibrio sp.]|uniref:hypothetical protein n=1 Tax=Desulfovibrio sp. TaxID=885 RepID=UPI0025B9F64E|nr:hypothetical protein [Desulfovibrio sp.]MCI7568800.1 hypothetical protein [Desulfovibrio sp.]
MTLGAAMATVGGEREEGEKELIHAENDLRHERRQPGQGRHRRRKHPDNRKVCLSKGTFLIMSVFLKMQEKYFFLLRQVPLKWAEREAAAQRRPPCRFAEKRIFLAKRQGVWCETQCVSHGECS